MSDNPHHHHDPTEELEEADEAFLDLEDPSLDIIDDGGDDDNNEEDAGGSEDGDDNNGGAHENEEDETGEPEPGVEVEDLNASPDYDPERDDSTATFSCPDPKPFHAVAASPALPNCFAVAGEDEEIHILDFVSNELQVRATLRGHTDTVSLLSFSPDGKYLASGSLDSTVTLWRTSPGEGWERSHVLTDLYGEIMSLLWHPSSLVLVASAEDAQSAMWNVTKGTLSMYFVGHRGPVTTCIWSTDHKKLVTGSSDGSVIVFSPKTGEQEASITKDLSSDNAGVTALCFVNEDQCVVGCEDGTLHIASLRAGKAVRTLEEVHEQAIETVKCNENATLFFTTSCDCRVVVWNCADLSKRSVFNVGESIIPGLWIHSHFIAVGCSDGTIRVWDGRSSETQPLFELMGHRRMILDLAAEDGKVVSACDDGSVKVFVLPSFTFSTVQ